MKTEADADPQEGEEHGVIPGGNPPDHHHRTGPGQNGKHPPQNPFYLAVSAGTAAGNHSHTILPAGGGQAHNNMPPYIAVHMWQRTK